MLWWNSNFVGFVSFHPHKRFHHYDRAVVKVKVAQPAGERTALLNVKFDPMESV